jgi:endonuclease/exonuclease/phosphatase family metal-dependent hydrolase
MPEICVATFNTHWGLDVAGNEYDVAAVCEKFDADVVVLQEVWRPARGAGYPAEAAARLGADLHEGPFVGGPHGGTWRRVYTDDEEDAAFGVAVLSRFPVVSKALTTLGKAPLDMHRALLRIELDVEGFPLVVFATHLCYLPHGSLWQLARLRRLTDIGGYPGVLAGDMNMWGPVVVTLLSGWRRAVRAKTWPAHAPHSQIDHILVRGPVRVIAGETLPATPSDHLPLRCRLSVGG